MKRVWKHSTMINIVFVESRVTKDTSNVERCIKCIYTYTIIISLCNTRDTIRNIFVLKKKKKIITRIDPIIKQLRI